MKVFQKDLDKLYEKLDVTQAQIIQTDYKLNQVEIMCRKEPFSQKLDTTNTKLDSMRAQDDQLFTKVNFMSDDSSGNSVSVKTQLDNALAKIESLNSKTTEYRVKQVEESVDIAETNINKALEASKKLDETLSKLEKLNEKMELIEPELTKLNSIELTLDRFDGKQNKLISILLDAISRKKPTGESQESSPEQAVTSTYSTPEPAVPLVEEATTSKATTHLAPPPSPPGPPDTQEPTESDKPTIWSQLFKK